VFTASSTLDGLRALDRSARLDSPIHRIHPVVALLGTLAFVLTVVSFPPREVARLLPFVLVPVAGASLAGVPARLVASALVRAAPFALLVAAPALLLDRTSAGGDLPLTGGMLTFGSVLLRLFLSVGAATVLAATTGVEGVAWAMGRLGLPRSLGAQVVLLHRHLLALVGEGARMNTARDLRAFGRGRDIGTWGALVGSLLLRALARGHRVAGAMALRGFDGEIRSFRARPLGAGDLALLVAVGAGLAVLRAVDLPARLGAWILEILA
jgi:cobalt/nickel transport system permease protein